MEPSEAKRLKALEDENAKLKRLLAEAMLDTHLRHLKLEIGRFLAFGSHNFKGLVSAAAKVV